MKPSDPVDDGRLGPGEIPARYGAYSPANSDGTYLGIRPAGEGLIDSRNTMTIRVGLRTGLDRVADAIERAGLCKAPPRYPSLCLGTFETNLKDLTSGYTVFATGGSRLQPFLIDHVTDAEGHLLYKSTGGRVPVFSPQATRMTTELLGEVIERGTASRAYDLGLRGFAAGKTGTTNNFVDAWFLGFDSRLTCGVWVGFDQPRTIRPGGYGATLALPIWVDIIQAGKN
jgi:penicillin-binding protein 1A